MYRLVGFALLALTTHPIGLMAQRSDSAGAVTAKSPVILSNAHFFTLRNAATQSAYRIYVALPPDYENSGKRYPVVYILDADNTFALVTQAYRLLRVDSMMPDLLFVGIGYEGSASERRLRRNRDLTPTRISTNEATGESAQFLSFLAGTIVSAVDSMYRTISTDRAIFGHSLGGLFALYALFERPDIFQRFIVSSPSLWWDGATILQHESRFARTRTSLPKSIYMSVGSQEPADMLQNFQPLADSIKSRRYADLRFTAVVLPEETHLTVVATSFLRGLRALYP